MSLRQKTVTGVSWTALTRIGEQGLTFLTTLVLARLLSPAIFGLLGMTAVFIGFINIFQNFGLGSSIVQAKEIDQEQLSGIFWINLGASLLLLLITVCLAPLLASFYNEPAITFITMALAVNFPLKALSTIPLALLTKRMAFKELAIIAWLSLIGGSITGIILAFIGFGVWALVGQKIMDSLINLVLFWTVVTWRPTQMAPYQRIKAQIRYGIHFQISSLFNYGTRNTDYLLVGRFIGSEALGIYQMAYQLMIWTQQNVTGVVAQVMFPTLSTIQDDKERVKKVYLKVTSSIALFSFPLVLGLWVVAPSFIYVVLGEKWGEVVPIFRILAILGLTQSTNNGGWILLSQGRVDLRLKLQVGFYFIYLTTFIIGLYWGIWGVALCYTLTSLVLMPIYFHVVGQLVNLTYLDIIRAVARILFCAALMAIFVWGIGFLLPDSWPHWAYLAVQIPLGGVIYLVLLQVFRVSTFYEVKEILYERYGNLLLKILNQRLVNCRKYFKV